MKKIIPILSGVGLVVILANSGGPGATNGQDRTGSPFANGDCASCHFGGDYGTEVTARLLLDNAEVDSYIPGETYTFQIKINTNAPAVRYGFQAVAISESTNANAGEFSEAPSGTQITDINGRFYFEHATKLTRDSFEIAWTAPQTGSGPVNFYVAGNAVNNANGSGGDDSDVLDEPLNIQEAITSGISQFQNWDVDWQIYPNPVSDQLEISISSIQSRQLQIRLLNFQGNIIQAQPVNPGTQSIRLFLKNQPAGLYFIQLFDGKQTTSKRIIKQ